MPTSDFVQTLRQASSRTTKPLALNGKGRLTTASDHAMSITMLAASLSGTSVRIDGMYPRRMSRQAESNALRKIFDGLSDPDRDYDVVMVSKGGKSVVNVLSRTPGQLTSVADMYAPANGAGDWFWSGRGARTVATPQAMASVEKLCDVFGYEGPEAMYAMADGSEYRDSVEMVAFANRIGHVREGNLMPLRAFDAGSIASALSLDDSVVFHANDPARGVMESGTSAVNYVGDATVADVIGEVAKSGVDPVCVRYDEQTRACVVGRCAERVAEGLDSASRDRRSAQAQASVADVAPSLHERLMAAQIESSTSKAVPKGFRGLVPSARYQFDLPKGYEARTEHARTALADATRYEGYGAKSRPDAVNVSSVNRWLHIAGVQASDVARLDERAGRHFMAFMSGLEPMTKSLQDWVEYQLDVPEGKLFSANHVMRTADIPGTHRALGREMSLAELTAGMRARGYSLFDANGTKHSAMFVRSGDVRRPVPNGNDRRPSWMDAEAQRDRDAQRRQREQAKAAKAAAREASRQAQYGGVGKMYGSTPSSRAGLQAWMNVYGVDMDVLRSMDRRSADAVELFLEGRQGMVESVRDGFAAAFGIPADEVYHGHVRIREVTRMGESASFGDEPMLAELHRDMRDHGMRLVSAKATLHSADFVHDASVRAETPVERARDAFVTKRAMVGATPERVDSVARWMSLRGVTVEDLSGHSFDGKAVAEFMRCGTPLPKRIVPWLENTLGIPAGCAFEARHPVTYVHTDKTMRELGHPEELADVVEHMGTSEFRCAAVDPNRGSVGFERTVDADMSRIGEFLRTGFASDIARDMASTIVVKTMANGANPDIETVLSERLGVPVMGGIAETSASAIMDVALGLRSEVAGYDRDTCMDVMCGAVRQMVEDASELDVSMTVERLFEKQGYRVDLTECSDATLKQMAETPGHLDHLPWSQRDDDGVWHSMVRVEDTIFVEDGRGITAYPIYETTDVSRAYNILCASVDGIAQKDATSRLVNLSDDSFGKQDGESKASGKGLPDVDDTISNRNKSRGQTSPSSHYRRGFFGLRTCGPQHSDYRITYVSACSVGVDEFACDLTRVHKVDERGVLSRESLGAFLVDKLLDGRQRMFDAHRELATRYPGVVKPFDSIEDVVVEIHTNDPHLMDGVDTRGAKYRIVTDEVKSAHSGDDIELG